MALGAYALVRYSNELNDQRVNLGVLLWHPFDGFRTRFTRQLERARAVDPRVRVTALKQQIEAISDELKAGTAEGRDTLSALAKWFRRGIEVTAPYPAEVVDVDATLETLYQRLISPVEEIRRASSQSQFERSFKAALVATTKRAGIRVHDLPVRRVNGISVSPGMRTVAGSHRALWRPLSLQAEDRPADQIAKAKATALDINVVRSLDEFRKDQQFVALQSPKPRAAESLKDAIAWLKHESAEVILVESKEGLAPAIESRLTKAASSARH